MTESESKRPFPENTESQPEKFEIDVEALSEPIPDMFDLRKHRDEYRDTVIPIDESDPRSLEPLVAVCDWGIAGQPYYSRPNNATIDPVPESSKHAQLRLSVAQTLSQINQALRDPKFTEFFGGEVELFIQEGTRTRALQDVLHDKYYPEFIKRKNPDWTDEQVAAEADKKIAPGYSGPHLTGGPFDVVIRYVQPTYDFVPNVNVPMQNSGETGQLTYPDYYEHNQPRDDKEKLFQRNRRALYAIMTGKAIGIDTGFVVHPYEWWHFGMGDRLSERAKGKDKNFYPPIYSVGGPGYEN